MAKLLAAFTGLVALRGPKDLQSKQHSQKIDLLVIGLQARAGHHGITCTSSSD
jgi:hypothetical protein